MERLPLFDENFSKFFIRPHVQRIAEMVSGQVSSTLQPGWMTGLAGMAIFLGEYGDAAWDHHDLARRSAPSGILTKIVDLINEGFSYPTLAAGLTGIVWAFRYLGERGLIDSDDAHVLDELIPFIRRFAVQELDNKNFDALHGGTGPVLVNVINNWKEIPGALGLRAGGLSKHSDHDLDLGLAHGLPSLILYYSEWCKDSDCHPCEGRDLMASSLSILMSHADLTQKNGSVFPTRLQKGIAQYPSRLAWCYGDVGIGMSLLRFAQGSKSLPRTGSGVEELKSSKDISDFAVDVLVCAADRREAINTRVEDPYFCHGTSGLAFMFYKAWRISKDAQLKEAAQFWTIETIRFLETTHPVGKVYKTEGVTFGDGSLLNGLSGIGLSLLSIETGVISGWEKGLMI